MQGQPPARVVRSVYRSLQRAVRRHAASASTAGLHAVGDILSRVHLTAPLKALKGGMAPADVVANEFRMAADEPREALQKAVDAASRIWRRVSALDSDEWQPKPAFITHDVGTVATHRLHGYRMVLAGWTPECEASASWVHLNGVSKLPKGTAQPFYNCLVDTRDRGIGDVTYVAQENVLPMAAPQPILHPAIGDFFEAWVPGLGYLPTAELQEEYPEDAFVVAALQRGGQLGAAGR